MTLMNFEPATTATRPPARVVAPKVVLTESVTLTQLPSQSRTDLLVSQDHWGWSELRDYVVSSIEARFGAFPRDARKEASIFTRFAKEYPQAPAIARYAFEVCDGWWKGAPVSINRFCIGSDVFFAIPITARLTEIS